MKLWNHLMVHCQVYISKWRLAYKLGIAEFCVAFLLIHVLYITEIYLLFPPWNIISILGTLLSYSTDVISILSYWMISPCKDRPFGVHLKHSLQVSKLMIITAIAVSLLDIKPWHYGNNSGRLNKELKLYNLRNTKHLFCVTSLSNHEWLHCRYHSFVVLGQCISMQDYDPVIETTMDTRGPYPSMDK